MVNNINYRLFDLQNENFEKIVSLYEATYGDPERFRRRTQWQYYTHPQKNRSRILVAEHDNKIAAASSHLPFDLLIDGKPQPAFYASDSMVHPEYRRRGIMETLTRMNAESIPVIYAKGTNPGMYNLRLKFGFRDVRPNNYMLCMLSPLAWLAAKVKVYRKAPEFIGTLMTEGMEVSPIARFEGEFDEFWAEVSPRFPGISLRNKEYMNWRYLSHPFKKYQPVYIKKNRRLVSLFVARAEGYSAYLVDILWDPQDSAEPSRTIRVAKRYLKKSGLNKIYFWATYGPLRRAMKKNLFFELKDTPKFTVFGPRELMDRLADGSRFHFVDGDCDNEYL